MISAKNTFFLSLSAVLMLCTPAFPANILTWQECFDRTARNNLDLSIARLKLEEASAQLKSQQSVLYPDLTARAGRTVGESKAGGNGWDGTEGLSASLTASYTLFDGYGNRARISKSEAELAAEQANFEQTCANVEYDLRRAFADQLYAQELLDLTQNIVTRRTDNVRLVTMRYEGGRENKGSLLLKQAQLQEAQYGVGEAERALEVAQRRLASLMKQSRYEPFRLAGELRADPPPSDCSLEELARLTPSYRSAEAALLSAEQGFLITRSARFPQIGASASLTGSGENEIRNEAWQAGLSVTLPIFTGGKISQDIIAAGLRLEQSRLNGERTVLNLMNTLQTALNSFRDRYAALSVQDAQLLAAETRAQIARTQYEQGLISFQDWDTIETQLITAQKNRLASRRNADQAESAWQNAMGTSGIRRL